jgi:CheY-like chemotaxis protein
MDDEVDIRDIVSETLQAMDIEALAADLGQQAIELFAKRHAETRPVAACILDLSLPGGMGGLEVAKAILAIAPGTKIVFCSGFIDEDIQKEIDALGPVGVLPKPFTLKQLRETVSTLFAESNAQG